MDDSRKVGQGKNDTQQQDLLPHWPAVEWIEFEHDCPEIRPCKEADAALNLREKQRADASWRLCGIKDIYISFPRLNL